MSPVNSEELRKLIENHLAPELAKKGAGLLVVSYVQLTSEGCRVAASFTTTNVAVLDEDARNLLADATEHSLACGIRKLREKP